VLRISSSPMCPTGISGYHGAVKIGSISTGGEFRHETLILPGWLFENIVVVTIFALDLRRSLRWFSLWCCSLPHLLRDFR
jgi:hypothetical protein